MALGAWIRRAGAMGLALAFAACQEIADPTAETVSLEIVPSLPGSAAEFANAVDNLRILIEMQSATGTFSIVADTTVAIDPVTGEASAEVEVPLVQDQQTYRVTLQALQLGVVIYAGTTEVTISRTNADSTTEVTVPVVYAGPPFTQLTISPRDTVVTPGARFSLIASATNNTGNVTTPAPLVAFSLLNPADAVFMTINESGDVTVAQGAITAEVIVQAMTPDSVIDHALIQIGDFPPIRRRWVVDPNAASPWPTQFGTDSYPFSTIERGMNRALIRDTVFVAVSTYLETVTGVRPVILLGDSTLAGVPTVSSPTRNSITSPTGPVDVRRMRFQGTNSGLDLRATALKVTSTQFQGIAGPALVVTQSGFTTVDGITINDITGAMGRGIQMFQATSLTLRNANINGTDGAGIRVDSVGVVDIAQTEIQQTSRTNELVYAVELVLVDSVLIDNTNIRNTGGGGIGAGGIRTLTARNDSITSTFANSVPDTSGQTGRTSMFIQDVANAQISGATFIDNNAGGILAIDSSVNAVTSIQNSYFEGTYWGAWGVALLGSGSISTFSVTNSTFRGQRSQPSPTRGIAFSGMQSAVATGNTLDSITGWGITLFDNATVTVDNNILRDLDDPPDQFVYPGMHIIDITSSGRFTNNQVRTSGTTAMLFHGALVDVLVTNNVFDANLAGIRLDTAQSAGVDMVTANNNQITNHINQGILTLEMMGNFQSNNIFGNGFGVDNQTQNQVTVDARNSWWGDVLGPACGIGATDCNGQSAGNAVSANVTVTPFATGPVTPPFAAESSASGGAARGSVRLDRGLQSTAVKLHEPPRPALRRDVRR